MDEFLAIGIVGTGLSLLVEWVKGKYGATSMEARALAVGGSVLFGTMFWYLSKAEYYQSVLGVLASASTIYALFFSSKPKKVQINKVK